MTRIGIIDAGAYGQGARMHNTTQRLPYTVRSSHPSLPLVHKSMVEVSCGVCASQIGIFRIITFPTAWQCIFVRALFPCMTSIPSPSASLFLTLVCWKMLSFGFILIVKAAACFFVINRIVGTKIGGMFG
jgi:ABC-type Fe3+ transport system permease subunit